LLHGLKFKINLIPYNSDPGNKYKAPSQKQARKFQKYLLDHDVVAPLRISKGQDIQGACGQLVVTKSSQSEINVGKIQLLATEI
jgi:23S rRNA (adenine2503-C2)-methyltransferase